jgi:uncharacterized surface protein with fasciclin (FAS1) repeats
MKMVRKLHIILYVCLSSGILLGSCAKELNQYYNPKGSLDKNIVEVLEADGRFSLFVKMIDKTSLRKTLGASAMYTCLAPKDEQVTTYLSKLGYSGVESVPDAVLRRYINYHFINGMYYEYDINKLYNSATSLINKSRATNFTTRTEGTIPGKRIRLFSGSFLQAQQDDYMTLYGTPDGDKKFLIEGIVIAEPDKDASNGVIHVLGAPLEIAPRTDEALASDPQTSIFSSWIEKHVQFELGEKDEFGWVDTTLYKSFSFGRNLANESVLSTVLAPTDDAIRAYFQPYLQYIDNTIDSVPRRVMYTLIRSALIENLWYKSDLKRLNPDWKSISGYSRMIVDVPSIISGSLRASNSFIYKVNKLIESPEMSSVAGGVYLRYKKYSQWYWMFLSAGLSEGLFDWQYYQHSPKTVLIQSDEVWGFPLAEDMLEADRLYRVQQCKAGIFNIDVRADGGFRKKFYPTNFGYILYDNGKFFDYTGNSVNLVAPTPEWEASNGAIYGIDGFLKPLDKLNDTITVYNLMKRDPELSLYISALDRSGIASQLQLTGFFTYSVIAPRNAAITAAGINVATLNATELRSFVQTYIIPNRYIFTDGDFNGQIANKNGELLTVGGQWETFGITNTAGKTVRPVAANTQGSNGVIHKINSVF